MTATGPRLLSRRLRAAALALATIGAVVAIGSTVASRPRAAERPPAEVPTTTAPVTRGTVSERLALPGRLGYQGSYALVHQARPGILTSAAQPGSTVERGGVLYAVANEPVRLLIGDTPAYRSLAPGMPDGPDVRQLEQNLVALGLDPSRQITVDDHFSSATAAAVRRWQVTWGVPASRRTGALALGQVLFQPSAVRISRLRMPIGVTVTPGSVVLEATSPTRVVTVSVSADRQASVHAGDQVVISLPSLAPVTGTVTGVGPVTVSEPGTGTAAQAPALPVTIGVTLPPGSPDLDQAPVQVAITITTHTDVLLVPIAALLARPGGGYQVRLDSGIYVPVQPGLFDDIAGLVEVTGSSLAAGQRVRVPAP